MDQWITLGIFLLGAGAGSLTSAVLYAAQIRKLKYVLERRPTTIPKQGERVHKTDGCKSA
jgi:hypothetical protein